MSLTFNPREIASKTADYTALSSDHQINVDPAAATTITLPAISTLAASGLLGKTFKILKSGTTAFVVTVSPNSADCIARREVDGVGKGLTVTTGTSYTINQYNEYVVLSAEILSDGTYSGYWFIDDENKEPTQAVSGRKVEFDAPLLLGASTTYPILTASTGTVNFLEVNGKAISASGVFRGILSYLEFAGTNVGVTANAYAIRGYSKISGTAAGSNTFYSAGVQGKLELSGTITGGKHCAVQAQLNSSAGLTGATGGTVYGLWIDGMQVSQTPASALNMTMLGIEMPDAAARFDSAIYVYGGATYLFDLANVGVGGGYGSLIAQAPGASTGSLKIRINGTDYYIPVTDDPTA